MGPHSLGRNEIPSPTAGPLRPRSHISDLWVMTEKPQSQGLSQKSFPEQARPSHAEKKLQAPRTQGICPSFRGTRPSRGSLGEASGPGVLVQGGGASCFRSSIHSAAISVKQVPAPSPRPLCSIVQRVRQASPRPGRGQVGAGRGASWSPASRLLLIATSLCT